MDISSQPIFLAFWIPEGEWEVRLDGPHQSNGMRHIHVRRKRKRKGEFSWNEDGSRHDKHRFPVSEAMIGKAKEIAASRLGVPMSSLEFLAGAPKGFRISILYGENSWLIDAYIVAEPGLVVLASEDWLILTSPNRDETHPTGSSDSA